MQEEQTPKQVVVNGPEWESKMELLRAFID